LEQNCNTRTELYCSQLRICGAEANCDTNFTDISQVKGEFPGYTNKSSSAAVGSTFVVRPAGSKTALLKAGADARKKELPNATNRMSEAGVSD
jgi:hypothetical protein